MKSRIYAIIGALVCVCMAMQFAPPFLKLARWSAGSKSQAGRANVITMRKWSYVRQEWAGNARFAVAAIRYLLEREPAQAETRYASNDTRKSLVSTGAWFGNALSAQG